MRAHKYLATAIVAGFFITLFSMAPSFGQSTASVVEKSPLALPDRNAATTQSKIFALTSQHFGWNGPLGFDLQYSSAFGSIFGAKWTQAFDVNNAASLQLGLGGKEHRLDATWGYQLTDNQMMKVGYEYLAQDISLSFDSGTVRHWVPQNAVGADYAYILNQAWFKRINVGASYSSAQSENLDSVQFARNGSQYTNYRHIAGGTDENVNVGLDAALWSTGLMTFAVNYDKVNYDKKYTLHSSAEKGQGVGPSIKLEQLVNNRLKVEMKGEKRKPYDDYEAGLSWLMMTVVDSRLELGLSGERTISHSNSPSDSRVSLSLDYSWGLPIQQAQSYQAPSLDSMNLVRWVSIPAVYRNQVLAAVDQESVAIPAASFHALKSAKPILIMAADEPQHIDATPYLDSTNSGSGTLLQASHSTLEGLPQGLSYNASTHIVSGSVPHTLLGAETSRTFTISDSRSVNAGVPLFDLIVQAPNANTPTANPNFSPSVMNFPANAAIPDQVFHLMHYPQGDPKDGMFIPISGYSIAIDSVSNLPAGLSYKVVINAKNIYLSTFTLSGTPTVAGDYSVVISGKDNWNRVTTPPLVITMHIGGAPTFNAFNIATGSVGQAYSFNVKAQVNDPMHDAGNLNVALAPGYTLPAGITLNNVGVLTGVATEPSLTPLKFIATNSVGSAESAEVNLSMNYDAADKPSFSASFQFPHGVIQQDYQLKNINVKNTFAIDNLHDAANFKVVLASGYQLPAGMILNDDGSLTGAPQSAGTVIIKLTATNKAGTTSSPEMALIIDYDSKDAPTYNASFAFPEGTVNQNYSSKNVNIKNSLVIDNLHDPVNLHVALASGYHLPGGIQLNEDGSLTGTPNASGTTMVKFTATNNAGTTSSPEMALIINYDSKDAPTYNASFAFPEGTVNQNYSLKNVNIKNSLVIDNLHDPVNLHVALASGYHLPNGIQLNEDGSLTGTPNASGTTMVKFTATNNAGTTSSLEFPLVVNFSPSDVPTYDTSYVLPQASVNKDYQLKNVNIKNTFIIDNLHDPLHFKVVVASGYSLPSGIQLNEDGTLTGAPTTSGSTVIKFSATNAAGTTTSPEITLTVIYDSGDAPSFNAGFVLPDGTLKENYQLKNINLKNSFVSDPLNDPAHLTLSVASGYHLPDDIKLNSDGTLTGIPKSHGTTTVKFTATNNAGSIDSPELVLVINYAPTDKPTFDPFKLPNGTLDHDGYIFHLGDFIHDAISDEKSLQVAVEPGHPLPPGLILRLSASGDAIISGMPTQEGTFQVQFIATNNAGTQMSAIVPLVILKSIPITLSCPTAGDADSAPLTLTDPATGTVFPIMKEDYASLGISSKVTGDSLAAGYLQTTGADPYLECRYHPKWSVTETVPYELPLSPEHYQNVKYVNGSGEGACKNYNDCQIQADYIY